MEDAVAQVKKYNESREGAEQLAQLARLQAEVTYEVARKNAHEHRMAALSEQSQALSDLIKRCSVLAASRDAIGAGNQNGDA